VVHKPRHIEFSVYQLDGLMVAVSVNDSDHEDDDVTVTPAGVTQVHPNRVFRRR
jgi:hypothetical protein